ncbi:activating signal cointegrator 1 complex subunit 2-like isoform X2 [Macadamia integrifolia]|uniref:activating signal cointegrator 1 complex subunit 2-like isoform X2 n=1 Tax=Macadamia integrifolia TaxID=60698 RepID=UPI001C4E89F6|nr:activating signal cointegrator 1 complex subunit 2-like isoform X2 [Macadamia integrifolia]
MSGRSTYNRQDGNRGAMRTQKKFVPKTTNTNTTISTKEPLVPKPALSTSLRRSFPTQSSDVAAATTSSSSSSSSSIATATATATATANATTTTATSITTNSRVRLGENGDWVSNRQQGGNFVNYLPHDEAVASGLGAEDGALDAVESQRVVDLLNRELSRLLNLPPRDFWREVASDASLHDFLDSYLQFRNRWYDFPHRGAKGIVAGVIVGELELSRRVFMALYRISSNRDPGALASDSLSAKEHGAILQEKKLLDLPKLLDICAVYGHDNEELTKLLVINSLKAQPKIHENLASVVSHFLNIVHTMHQRCSSSLEVLFSSGIHEDSRLYADFLEVMDFVNDAIASFSTFVNAYKPAAVFFSCPVETSYGNGELLTTLSRLHDSLLPSLQQGLRHMFTAQADTVQNLVGENQSNIASSFKMLSTRIVNFGWQLLDICYLSDEVFLGGLQFLASTKMFPANVEDPVIRGDILVQTFREIHGEVSNYSQENQRKGTFFQNIEKNYRMLNRLENLRGSGWIFMDEEQYQYLCRVVMPPSSKVVTREHNGPPLLTNKVQMDEDAAITESKISQIKDLFPEYGKGFLSACLEVYNQNSEEVIQRILDGTLHEDLQSLDISLENIPPPKSASSVGRNYKGKGALIEPAVLPSDGVVAAVKDTRGSSSSGSSFTGWYIRKSKDGLPDPSTLDLRNDKDLAKTSLLASQYEYEDEYDDSFDDLGLSLVDSGFEEPEILRDRISTTRGKSRGDETGISGSNPYGSKLNSQKQPQFYVKDGKNYSYKVSGSVAVGSAQEAAVVNQAQREMIHGLGRGGNVPLGAGRTLTGADEQPENQSETPETGGRGNMTHSRGRGRRGGGSNHYRKDRAMKKHFSGLGGY